MKYLIIPDVHGRAFWTQPVEESLNDPGIGIIFLGDYLDPYPQEWTVGEDECRAIALDRFKQILDIKRQNPERVTLLLGNHDAGYALGDDICSCRMDFRRRGEIESLFQENWELFRLALALDQGGRKYIFSHAGILKGWADLVWPAGQPGFDVVERLNTAWLDRDFRVLDTLGYYDGYRGYLGYKYGSPLWSDLRSWTAITPEETFGMNIVGHTQVKFPVKHPTIICLDCQQAFMLDESGIYECL